MSKNICYDHLGNEFASKSEMCKYYKISQSLYIRRLCYLGWSQKDALTKPIHPKVYDHLGNEFSSLSEMLDYYNIPRRSYYNCIEKGLSLEEILENRFLKVFEDHLGNKFVSKSAMLNHYGANKNNYNYRLLETRNLKYALTGDK